MVSALVGQAAAERVARVETVDDALAVAAVVVAPWVSPMVAPEAMEGMASWR